MEITEVRIKLMDDTSDRLRAFCSITFDDCFVVRDLKIIDGANGPFVAMPSRKLTAHCPQCGCKNHLRAAHCNQCGRRLPDDLTIKDSEGRAKLYADIAHPINSMCREMIQASVIAAYESELQLAAEPGYRSRYDDFYDAGEEGADQYAADAAPAARGPASRQHIEPAEPEPRGPHTPPARQSGPRAPREGKKRRGFGEGIFD
ncbi:MAG: SpoVG family protein [Planctomycetales bacterium]|nr:SpoVG family protein [Planctomycetales bacterium]